MPEKKEKNEVSLIIALAYCLEIFPVFSSRKGDPHRDHWVP